MVTFGKRMPDMPLYALFLIPLVVVFVLRMVSMAPRRVQAGEGQAGYLRITRAGETCGRADGAP